MLELMSNLMKEFKKYIQPPVFAYIDPLDDSCKTIEFRNAGNHYKIIQEINSLGRILTYSVFRKIEETDSWIICYNERVELSKERKNYEIFKFFNLLQHHVDMERLNNEATFMQLLDNVVTNCCND